MTGYCTSKAITKIYEANKAAILAARDKPDKHPLIKKIVDQICKTGKGSFDTRRIREIVEHDVLHGNPAVISEDQPDTVPEQKQSAKPEERHYYHSGDIGDIIFFLPGLMNLGGGYIHLGADPKSLKPCAPNGPRQPITHAIYNFIEPLLTAQPYVLGVTWSDTMLPNWHNANLYRKKFVGGGFHLNLAVEQVKTMGASPIAVNAKWLTVPPGCQDTADVIIARSPRYHNHAFPWKEIVAKYGEHAAFIGLDAEYTEFCRQYGKVRRIVVSNALELARAIECCHLFIGNASAPQAVAEGLKKPMIVERYRDYEHAHFPRPSSTYYSTGALALPNLNRQPRIYHVVPRYIPTDQDARRRVNFATGSWEYLYQNHGVVPVHVWSTERNSSALGDPRAVPYWKDVLQAGLEQTRYDDDVIFFTNDDIVIAPDIVPVTREFLAKHDAGMSFRIDYKGPIKDVSELKPYSEKSPKAIISQGRDLCIFKKRWLLKHINHFPDYLLGTPEWDYFLAIYLRWCQNIPIVMSAMPVVNPATEIPTGYIWHEKHDPWVRNVKVFYTSPANRHNFALTRQFLSSAKLHYVPSGAR